MIRAGSLAVAIFAASVLITPVHTQETPKKSFADGAAAIKAKGDNGISGVVVDPFAQDNPNQAGKDQIRLGDLACSLVEHSGEIYGQLTVYYRVGLQDAPQ